MGVDITKMKEKLSKRQHEKDSQGRSFWKPEDGRNRIRILPPKGDDGEFSKEVSRHFNVAKFPMNCRKDLDKKCPICDAVASLFATKDPGDMELAKKIRAKKQWVMNIVDVKNSDKKPLVFWSGPMIYDQILSYFADDEWGDISDPKKGYDLIIEKTGEGLDTDYKLRTAKDSTELEDSKKLTKASSDLNDLVEYPSEKEMENALNGQGSGDDSSDDDEEDDEDEDEDDDKAKSKKVKGKKSDEDEESDDEDEDDDSDSDDEDEDEKKSEKKTKKSKDEDEEEGDDDDDDEEDEKKSSEKTKSKSKKDDDEDEDEDSDDEDDEDEDDEDDKKSSKKPKSKSKSDDDDEDEEDDSDDDDDDEDDEDEKPSKKSKDKGKLDVSKALANLRKNK